MLGAAWRREETGIRMIGLRPVCHRFVCVTALCVTALCGVDPAVETLENRDSCGWLLKAVQQQG
jgi:hypothetical protein